MAKIAVAPLVGAWIEMYLNGNEDQPELVAPLVGAWIEITSDPGTESRAGVAPLVGAWIEIDGKPVNRLRDVASLPSWERGLKSNNL